MMTLPANQTAPTTVHNPSTLEVKSSSPNVSPPSSPRHSAKQSHKRDASVSSTKDLQPENDSSSTPPKTSSEQGSGGELSRSNSQEPVKERKTSDRVKKKAPWYSALYPTYKSRSDDFKRIFKDIPIEERLVVDYSCALQRDILVHGRLYVSQNYLCFYANIFRWETQVTLRWKDVTSLTKEKTALVIPNAILVHTTSERYFLTSFAARDKTFLMLFRVWQNALMDQNNRGDTEMQLHLMELVEGSIYSKCEQATETSAHYLTSCEAYDALKFSFGADVQMSTQEMWQWVHSCYGDELGLTSDDDDYVAPTTSEATNNNQDDEKSCASKCDRSLESSYSEPLSEGAGLEVPPSQAQTATPSPSEPIGTDPSDSSPSESESEKLGYHQPHITPVSITTDVKQSPWVENPSTNQKDRTVSLTVQLGHAIGPKHAQVSESQKMLSCSKPGEMYAIEVEASNSGVPYADAFNVLTHYCLTRGADPGTSTIAVYCQIKYKKSVWGLVKNYIEKHCWMGIEEYYNSLVKALKEECERTRRAMASGVAGTKRRGRRRTQSKPVLLPPPIAEEPLIQPLALPQPPPVQQADSMVWIVFCILATLLVFNAALYYKLWGLEQYERTFENPEEAFDILRHAPQTPDDWKILLQKQEQLHTAEVERWMRILKASVYLLNQVESSLSKLQLSLDTMIKSNLNQHGSPPNVESPPDLPQFMPHPNAGSPRPEDQVINQNSQPSDSPPPPTHKSEL